MKNHKTSNEQIEAISEVFPLIWTKDVAVIADWATTHLGLTESWRAPSETGEIEHAELHWYGGKVSINIKSDFDSGPAGISLRIDDRAVVKEIYDHAISLNTQISQALAESRVAYSFTAIDPDGNQWWVNAETGFLDELRANNTGA